VLAGCSANAPTPVSTSDWQPMPTYVYNVFPLDVSEYRHYTSSEGFDFHVEFDYPSNWWLQEHRDETGIRSVFLADPGFLTLPTPAPPNFHPEPHEFGSVFIWILPNKDGQNPETELELHKQNYQNIHWMKVLDAYKVNLDGYDASVLEYQIEPFTDTGYISLMFARRIYFMVNDQLYEIIYTMAEKERGGEFEKGYEYFFNSLKIVP
jgi:hypothetical protein